MDIKVRRGNLKGKLEARVSFFFYKKKNHVEGHNREFMFNMDFTRTIELH